MSSLPDYIQKDIARQCELELELRGIEMTNVYGQDLDFQIKLNTRRVEVLRSLAEVSGRIQKWIDAGYDPGAI